MDEVDNIIIHSLRDIGCDIEDGVTKLSGFSTELVVEATVRCLDAIRPGLGLSTTLPANMAQRFRLGAALAQACLDLGYRGDIGYQTFLYTAEVDLRRVFIFLIEKLPRESEKTFSEPSSKIGLLEKSIASSVTQSLAAPWLPNYCHRESSKNKGSTVPYDCKSLDVASNQSDDEEYYRHHHQLPVPSQIENLTQLLPSLLSTSAKSLHVKPTNIIERIEWLNFQRGTETVSPSRKRASFLKNSSLGGQKQEVEITSASAFDASQSTSETRVSPSREEKQEMALERARKECDEYKSNVEELQMEVKTLGNKLSQIVAISEEEEKEWNSMEEQRVIKARVYDLLEGGEDNVKKLEATIETISNRLIHLAAQWEKHRAPLIQKYRDEREKYSTKASASQKKLEELRILKEKEKEFTEECRNKDQQYSQLVTEVQKLPKEVNRSAYTQRILEIINNVQKQRDEINNVLADTRELQKEINTLGGRLERSFTVVDELIFRDARTNEASRRAYKFLATLHSDCSELVTLVEETGSIVREIRDLEEQIDLESTKNVGANLERITADLKQMQQETAALTVQLQNKSLASMENS